ncbi:hypothetical protein AB0O91_18140 [Kitasatospora sp. NPDC089797]|uniref:hypothetical protein n=1 Tax=Kitasatospora sp. NPDC089797 TaxID=3155298 RepID=UPI0034332F95
MSVTTSESDWPGVRPEVVAEVVSGLSARLQKRLDGAAAKLAQRPVSRVGGEWRVQVDEEALLVLHAPDGVVVGPDDVRCGCLLAPACVHRAAAVSLCPLAEAPEAADTDPAVDAAGAGNVAGTSAAIGAVEAGGGAGASGTAPAPAAPTAAPPAALTPAELAAARPLHRAACALLAAGVSGAGAVAQAELLRAAHRARVAGLYRPAAAAVAVVTRIRSARSGAPEHRLADLVAGLRDLLALTTALTAPALAAPAPASPTSPAVDPAALAALRGTARQSYAEEGGLRLYGLFAEPVLTATHAGAVSWAVDAGGRLSTVAEVMPHGDATAAAPLAVGAGNRTVRLGDAALSHREFSRGGLAVQGATRSVSGRLGAGASVRAVRAAGAAWTAEPSVRLWSEPPAAQVARALAAQELPYESRPAGSDLLFLDVTLLGAAPTGPDGSLQLLARARSAACGPVAGPPATEPVAADLPAVEPVIALRPGHEHPDLAFRANLALLATAPGLRLRLIGRLERADHPELRVLAIGTPPDTGGPAPDGREPHRLALPADRSGRVNLGLERLQTADLQTTDLLTAELQPDDLQPDEFRSADPRTPPPGLPAAPPVGPPVHVLGRRVEQTVTTGRSALAPSAATAAADRGLLRAAGLATAAELLDGLRAAGVDQRRDVFGRVVPDDHEAFATAWLAAADYIEALATALCAAAWGEEETARPDEA